MPMLGARLPATKFEVINRIPSSREKLLPKNLPVFRYSAKPHEFSSNGLQMLLDQSVFSGTNVTTLLHGQTNTALLGEPARLATTNNIDYFFVDPLGGAISVFRHGTGVDFRRETPPFDAVPNFDSIRDDVLHYAAIFGVSTNEMERKDDGSIFLRKTDDKTVARGGAVKFMSRRSVRVSRSAAGYPFLANDDKIEMAVGVNGRLLKFDLKWRTMEAVRTNRLFTIDQVLDNIKNGNVFAEEINQYPSDGISQITIKDFRIFYYLPTLPNYRPVSTNADIVPIASLYAVFKSKSGKTEEGSLYTPLVKP